MGNYVRNSLTSSMSDEKFEALFLSEFSEQFSESQLISDSFKKKSLPIEKIPSPIRQKPKEFSAHVSLEFDRRKVRDDFEINRTLTQPILTYNEYMQTRLTERNSSSSIMKKIWSANANMLLTPESTNEKDLKSNANYFGYNDSHLSVKSSKECSQDLCNSVGPLSISTKEEFFRKWKAISNDFQRFGLLKSIDKENYKSIMNAEFIPDIWSDVIKALFQFQKTTEDLCFVIAFLIRFKDTHNYHTIFSFISAPNKQIFRKLFDQIFSVFISMKKDISIENMIESKIYLIKDLYNVALLDIVDSDVSYFSG